MYLCSILSSWAFTHLFKHVRSALSAYCDIKIFLNAKMYLFIFFFQISFHDETI